MRIGLELWAADTGRELELVDDRSDPLAAADVHSALLDAGCAPVLGPYGSDTTRAVALAGDAAVVWNHGAAADDVQRLPGVVSVATPAGRYLVALAKAAAGLGATRVAVSRCTGPVRAARTRRTRAGSARARRRLRRGRGRCGCGPPLRTGRVGGGAVPRSSGGAA